MKEIIDLEMYKSLVKDYKLNERGGIQLIRICLNRLLGYEREYEIGANDKFIISYKEYIETTKKI